MKEDDSETAADFALSFKRTDSAVKMDTQLHLRLHNKALRNFNEVSNNS